MDTHKNKIILIIGIFSIVILSYFLLPSIFKTSYSFSNKQTEDSEEEKKEETKNDLLVQEIEIPKVQHLETPVPLKALYMTSWVAGTASLRTKVIQTIEETEANAIVIDIKDYTGKITFPVENENLVEMGSIENRIPNIKSLIEELHAKDIYVIGRISVFQDQHLIQKRPDLAVKKSSNKNELWRDNKKIGWLDAGSKEVWDYAVLIAKESYDMGFDELNFDYIRFPSDGNMKDIYFPFSEGKQKSLVLAEFFKYLRENLDYTGAVISADLFGMTTTNTDDLNIGQVLELALPYFDFICPMVYPSHYPKGFNGYTDVNKHSYDIVNFSLKEAVKRTVSETTTVENVPNSVAILADEGLPTERVIGYTKEVYSASKIRPWLQDFNYPVTYTKEMVREQIQATYDAGLDSWMMWDPANTYTKEALLLDVQ